MDFNGLQAFLAVAETGSFSRAAQRLYLTQPAVSKRLATLEDELGLVLFDRVGRRVTLTHAGEVLLPRARELLLQAQDMKHLASELTEKVSGPLVLGTSHHIGLHRLPDVLRHYRDAYPDVQLDIRFMDSEAACRSVEKGELELAVVTLPTAPTANLQVRELWQDELCFVVSPEHPLAGEQNVSLKQLVQYPAVLPGPTTYTRSILEDALHRLKLDITLGMSTNYMETLKMLAEINLGWSLLPRTMLEQSSLEVLPVKLQLKRSLGLVTHTGRILSNPAQALISCLP
ncbi:LysR family transcriptional regulator [Thiolapillus sp.]